jgi:hypothetical protein
MADVLLKIFCFRCDSESFADECACVERTMGDLISEYTNNTL